MPNQEHERERDQTHSYWYIPSAPRENYSLLVMESTGMRKMAAREGFPLRQSAGTGLDWLSVATEASSGRTPDLLCSRMFLGYMGLYRRKKYVRGAMRGLRGWRARPGGWARPLPRALLVYPLSSTPSLLYCFLTKNNFSEGFIPFGLRLVFLFCETLKQGKNRNWHCALG